MLGVIPESELAQVGRGSHVCWVVLDPSRYLPHAKAFIDAGIREREKIIVFGPSGGRELEALRADAAVAVDPRVDLLEGGFDAQAMFGIFREQDRIARSEGFVGLRIMADMDWMAAAGPTADDVIEYELLGDRLVRELGATAICAYRPATYDADTVAGAQAVHRYSSGGADPVFQMTAGDDGTWELAGEVDVETAPRFTRAVGVAAGAGPCVIDVRHLRFIDVLGLRTLAGACGSGPHPVRLRRASPMLRRFWQLGGFEGISALDDTA